MRVRVRACVWCTRDCVRACAWVACGSLVRACSRQLTRPERLADQPPAGGGGAGHAQRLRGRGLPQLSRLRHPELHALRSDSDGCDSSGCSGGQDEAETEEERRFQTYDRMRRGLLQALGDYAWMLAGHVAAVSAAMRFG